MLRKTYSAHAAAVTHRSLTDLGRTLPDAKAVDRLRVEYTKSLRENRRARRKRAPADEDGVPLADGEADEQWRERLLDALLDMPPESFERLSERLGRCAGRLCKGGNMRKLLSVVLAAGRLRPRRP